MFDKFHAVYGKWHLVVRFQSVVLFSTRYDLKEVEEGEWIISHKSCHDVSSHESATQHRIMQRAQLLVF